jgi:hypothetical protein
MSNSELTFEKCYRLLGVDEETSRDELKHEYRRQSQIWHPDKAKYNNTDLATAKQRFMLIQEAFSILDHYYETHASLPPLENNTGQEAALDATTQSESNSGYASPHDTYHTTEPKKPKRILPIVFMFLLLGIFVYILFLSADDEIPPAEKSPINTASDKKTFTQGSTMREVTDAQGFPTMVKDNVWFYGKSHVQFKDGIVDFWFVDDTQPLNVRRANYSEANETIKASKTSRIEKNMTKTQIREIQGEPMQDLGDVWVYGTSKIYFKDDQVVSWINSPLNPLRVE